MKASEGILILICLIALNLASFEFSPDNIPAEAQESQVGSPAALFRLGPNIPNTPPLPPQVPGPTDPVVPPQPAPDLAQRDPLPGRPTMPPERSDLPALNPQKMVITPEHIRQAQHALRAQGLQPGADGQMDEKTQLALQQFQKMNNLPPTGVLDESTAAKLGVDLHMRQ